MLFRSPLVGVIVIVEVPELPAVNASELGDVEISKLGVDDIIGLCATSTLFAFSLLSEPVLPVTARGSPFCIKDDLTSFIELDGFREYASAATPVTCGVAILVPL